VPPEGSACVVIACTDLSVQGRGHGSFARTIASERARVLRFASAPVSR